MPTKQGYIMPTQQGYIIFIHRPLPSLRGINIYIYMYGGTYAIIVAHATNT